MLCTDASPVHPVLRNLLLGADVITPVVCTDASPVQPVLKTWLLRDLHRLWNTVRPMHRCPFLNHRFNRCLKADLASISFCTKIPWRRFFRQPSGLTTPIFSFYLSSLEPKSLRMVILTIILVQVLCCHSITKITRNGINGAMFVI